eukprot:GGOE01061264.1.p1 GENE.GGOE01061264.1~~GGOE01061264.1.p1  ORF type:complete len:266 (+),score=37.15 GGOE01061264.1:45-800(+)
MEEGAALCTSCVRYYSSSAAVSSRLRNRCRLLWAASVALGLLMALCLLLPAIPITRFAAQKEGRGVQYGEVGKIVRASSLRFVYAHIGSYVGALVGSEVGAVTGEVVAGSRGQRAGEYIGDLFGRAIGIEMGRSAADSEILQMGWNVSRPALSAWRRRGAPVDLGGRMGRWVGGIAGADYGAVHGRQAVTKRGKRKSASLQHLGQTVGTLVGRHVGASLGQWVGHTLQVGMEHTNDVVRNLEDASQVVPAT